MSVRSQYHVHEGNLVCTFKGCGLSQPLLSHRCGSDKPKARCDGRELGFHHGHMVAQEGEPEPQMLQIPMVVRS